MRQVTLGKTGITVPRLCIGSLSVGPLQAALDIERAGEVLAYAFSKGLTFIDTAQLYRNYPHVAAALRRFKGDVVISSKTYAYTADMARDAVEEARRALGRDVIDIFMLHEQESVHTLRGHMEALEALYDYKAKGVVRAVGASMHAAAAAAGARELGLDVIHPLINMSGIGLVDSTPDEMLNEVRLCHEAGIGVFSMKPLGGGHLFKRAAEALGYVLDLPFIDSVAVGMQSEDEIDANISFFETRVFAEKHQAALSAKTRRLHIEEYCAACGGCCKVCPQRALEVRGGALRHDRERCIFCGYCAPVCPLFALRVL